MSTLGTLLTVASVLIAGVLAYAATRPDTFRVERSASIAAPPERIFDLINDLRRFNTWNPYERKDPSIKGSYSGAERGAGAAYAWESREVGIGRMEIVEAAEPSKVTMKLDFVKPFEAHNVVEFTMRPNGERTDVTWAMHGPAPYFSKLLGVFVNMDRMVGGDFEKGLGNLKLVAEH